MLEPIIAQDRPERKAFAHAWHRQRLIVPTDSFTGSIEVDALVHGWVAVRKGRTASTTADRRWIAFYVPTGLAFATAASQEEAQAVALAFKPHLQRMVDDFMDVVCTYNQTGQVPALAEREGR